MSGPVVTREIVASDPFDSCDYYDTDESTDSLTHDRPNGAIEYHFDELHEKGVSILECIAKRGPVTVYGFDRQVVSDEEIESYARRAAETVAEAFDEEYGDPHDTVHAVNIHDLADALLPAIKEQIGKTTVYSCERVAERVYSPAEVEAVLRAECPQWFEPVASEASRG